jgi:hypothetical protein
MQKCRKEINMSVENEKRLAALEAYARRHGLQLWELEMMKAVDDATMRDIVADSRRSREPSSILPPTREKPVERGTGWREPRPLESPPGLKYVDQQLDVADELERRKRAKELKGG